MKVRRIECGDEVVWGEVWLKTFHIFLRFSMEDERPCVHNSLTKRKFSRSLLNLANGMAEGEQWIIRWKPGRALLKSCGKVGQLLLKLMILQYSLVYTSLCMHKSSAAKYALGHFQKLTKTWLSPHTAAASCFCGEYNVRRVICLRSPNFSD